MVDRIEGARRITDRRWHRFGWRRIAAVCAVVSAAMVSGCMHGRGRPEPPVARALFLPSESTGQSARPGAVVGVTPRGGQIRLVAAQEPLPIEPPRPEPMQGADTHSPQPIDLGMAWAVVGGSHLQVAMARERTVQAQARYDAARFNWLPTFRFGVAWNKHDGRLQATEGDVINRGRNSLFVGGGAGLGNMPLNGGAGGPPRLMVNFSLADAFFDRRIESHRRLAAASAEAAVVNDAMLEVGLRYVDLMEAAGRAANARTILGELQALHKTMDGFLAAGAAAAADVDRVAVEAAHWERIAEDADRALRAAGTQLARQLQMDIHVALVPAEDRVVIWSLTPADRALDEWLAISRAQHPGITSAELAAAAEAERERKEFWRPWLPSVQVGATGGTFGGGPQSQFQNQGGRSDVDVLAVWELEQAGVGNRLRHAEAASRFREASLRAEWVHDSVDAQVAESFQDLESWQRQTRIAERAVQIARRGYERNRERIQSGEGLPVELIQALRSLASALDDYTKAAANTNRAQLKLLNAAGTGIENASPPSVPQ